jgi:uncharacterized membrane protein
MKNIMIAIIIIIIAIIPTMIEPSEFVNPIHYTLSIWIISNKIIPDESHYV